MIQSENIKTLTPALIEGMTHVVRWHSRPARRRQNIAEHSHQVALLALHLGSDLSADLQAQLMFWALVHDAHEVVYGDIPYPSKRLLCSRGMDLDGDFQDRFWGFTSNPLRSYPDLVLDIVDVADVLEAAVFAARWYPEGADEIRGQAEETIRRRFNRSETHGALARATAILEGLRHA